MVHAWWWGSQGSQPTYRRRQLCTHPARCHLPHWTTRPPTENRPSLTERAAANPCVRTSRGRAARAGRCRSERSGNAFWPPAFGTFDCSRQLRHPQADIQFFPVGAKKHKLINNGNGPTQDEEAYKLQLCRGERMFCAIYSISHQTKTGRCADAYITA